MNKANFCCALPKFVLKINVLTKSWQEKIGIDLKLKLETASLDSSQTVARRKPTWGHNPDRH